MWDQYIPNSLRGGGIRRRVNATNQLPCDWKGFLRFDENKKELFKFLAQEAISLGCEKQVISTFGEELICNPSHLDVSNLAPSYQEEADT